ncbi:MAG: GTPase ObgE [Lachnospiraceae bacterium]|nr:GTPase ObgE [Lachnospiraceae bacterium]
MFADSARIIIRSGKGGDGHVSFRREKYVPAGGPDGGDGGNGGSVIFQVDSGTNTLSDFRFKRKFSAEDGKEGAKKRMHGRNGKDIILKVPAGTVVKEAQTGKVIVDMSGENTCVTVLRGGHGGKGNQHFATPTMQAPKYAQPGQDAVELEVILELKCIADVGLVGFPNVGKSTLITRVTNARPQIANYPFTTIQPHLGVVDLPDGDGFVIADIPGLIEGASEGVGLGHQFLRHIERTKVLIHLVDAASVEGRNPIDDVYAINKELAAYDSEITNKPQIIAANKVDVIQLEDGEEDPVELLRKEFEPKGFKVFPISAATGDGLTELINEVREILSHHKGETITYEQEFFPEEHVADKLPYDVSYDEKNEWYVLEGPRIEKMLGYTNLESEKGFIFFQKFIREIGAIEKLEALGMEEGDTVKIYGFHFEYYKD